MSWDDDGYYDASHGVHKCRRYHGKLRDFYQAAYNYTVAANAFGASGVFISLLGDQTRIAVVLSAFVAFASLMESIFRYEHKARLHHDLGARFTRLAAEIEMLPETPSNLAKVRAARLEIEAEEPAEKRLVELMASNDEQRSRGVSEDQLVKLSFWQRNLGYLLTFGMQRLERERAARQRLNGAEVAQEAAVDQTKEGSA